MSPTENNLSAYALLSRGDFSQLPELLRSADGEWGLVFTATHANASQTPDQLRAAPAPAVSTDIGWLAVRQYVLRAAALHDLAALDALASAPLISAPLTSTASVSAVATSVCAMASAWARVLRGQDPGLDEDEHAELIERDPGVRVEITSLRALAASEHDIAQSTARRASRMASAEGILQMEYLANLVLARVRRRGGRPHLALRILAALEAVVPPLWKPWVQQERLLAGALPASTHPSTHASTHASTFHQTPPLLREELAAREAMHGGAHVSATAQPWVEARVSASPFGVAGAAVHPLFSAALEMRPRGPARRVLFAGLDPSLPLVADGAKARRLRLALCHIFGAPDGLEPKELFEQIYGFAYDDAGHDELLRGVIHRARKLLRDSGDGGELGDIVRDEGRVSPVVHRPFAVPDPRCERSIAERALTFLSASGGNATAREIARGMGVPLRSIQRALGDLVEEGSCETRARGRATAYVLEDTTFAEPTLHRLRGRHDGTP